MHERIKKILVVCMSVIVYRCVCLFVFVRVLLISPWVKVETKKTSVESQLSLSKNTEYKATNPNYGTPDQPERWSWLKQHRSRERGSETTPFCSEKIKLGKLVRQQWQPLCEL